MVPEESQAFGGEHAMAYTDVELERMPEIR